MVIIVETVYNVLEQNMKVELVPDNTLVDKYVTVHHMNKV